MSRRSFHLHSARRDDEAGAILILSVLFVVVMVAACALAIDLGFQAQDRRNDHKIADLAALDAARVLDDQNPCNNPAQLQVDITKAAEASAIRNGYDPVKYGLIVETGTVDPNGNFVPNPNACASQAVRVTDSSVTTYKFLPGTQTQHASAIATQKPGQGTQVKDGIFTMGSYLGSLDTNDATILDRLLCQGIRGTGAVCSAVNNSYLNTTLVGWQGIASGNMNLKALQQQLVANGYDVGTEDKFFNTAVKVKDLYTASAQVLNNQGNVAAANALNALSAQADASNTVKMGQFISANQGNGGDALDTQFNAFGLVIGSAMAENGSNFITVPDLGITIPGVSKTSVSLQMIEQPVTVGGPVGNSNTTAQAKLTITPTINKALSIAGLTTATLTGDLPVTVNGGGAKGTMKDYSCAAGPGLTAFIEPKPVTAGTAGTLALNGTLAVVPLVGGSTITATVPVSGSQTTNGASGDAQFAYPAEFLPPVSKRVGSTTLGLDTVAQVGQVNVTVGNGLINAQLLTTASQSALPPILANVDQLVLSRVSRLLGLNIGGADVSALNLTCNGQIGLIGLPFPALIK